MPEIKSFPFPVLSPDSADYGDGVEYTASIKGIKGAISARVSHDLRGDSLVASLLRDGDAAFACIVSVPSTMYRRIFVADAHSLHHSQNIDYADSGHGDGTDAVELPMFRPVIVARADITKAAGQCAGLGALWENTPVIIPDGAIIAFDNWKRFGGDGGGLLIVEKSDKLEDGQMRVEEDTAAGFRFRVIVGGGLYDRLGSPEEHSRHRRSVLTHAISAAFGILKERYGSKKDWGEHINLRLVADTLARENIKHWGDDDFSPELAATILYPHLFDDIDEGDGGDDYDD